MDPGTRFSAKAPPGTHDHVTSRRRGTGAESEVADSVTR